jgi:hypothetical protein
MLVFQLLIFCTLLPILFLLSNNRSVHGVHMITSCSLTFFLECLVSYEMVIDTIFTVHSALCTDIL